MAVQMKTIDEVLAGQKTADGAKITLAEKTWIVPARLQGFQIKKVAPAIYAIMEQATSAAGQLTAQIGDKTVTIPRMTEELLATLVQMVFWGLRGNYPDLTLDHFETMEWTPVELMGTLEVFQVGAGFKPPAKGEPAQVAPLGEDGAPANATGTNTSSD